MKQEDERLFDELVRAHAPSGGGTPSEGIGVEEVAGYRVLEELHRGGQGRVMQAIQESTGRTVALKFLLAGAFASLRQRRRFEREIELVAAMQHPGVVTIHDSGVTADGGIFLAMELIAGEPLDDYLRGLFSPKGTGTKQRDRSRERLQLTQILRLFGTICAAVAYAHQRGVIHRDLKPANILVEPSGRPRVLDFGLAKIIEDGDGDEPSQVTLTGEFVGTLAYASPEQTSGDPSAVDVRSDVYSLGVILYEMLTGRHPYRVSGPLGEVVREIVEVAPASMRGRSGDAPSAATDSLAPLLRIEPDLETIVLKALVKDKERRYQSVDQLARDLQHYAAGEPIEARRDSTWYVVRKAVGRHRYPVAAAVAFVVLLVVALVNSRWQAEVIASERDEAHTEASKARVIKEFLQGMLDSIEPEVARGRQTPVLDAMLAEASLNIEREFSDLPRVEAELRLTIGKVYGALALREQAEPHLRRAWELLRGEMGEEHPDTLEARARLAGLLTVHADIRESDPFIRKTWEIVNRVLPREDPLRLSMLEPIGFLHMQREEFEEGEAICRERAALSALLDGPYHPQTLEARKMLAELLNASGRTEEAAAMLEEVMGLMHTHLGGDWPEALSAANELGLAWIELGRSKEAETLFEETLERCLRITGEEHPLAAALLSNLGLSLLKQGRYAECLEVQKDVVGLYTRVLAPKHPTTLLARVNLGVGLFQVGRNGEALDALLEAYEGMLEVHPPEHSDLLFGALELAKVLAAEGLPADAVGLLTEVLEEATRKRGDDHSFVADVMRKLASLHGVLGQTDAEAELRSRLEAIAR